MLLVRHQQHVIIESDITDKKETDGRGGEGVFYGSLRSKRRFSLASKNYY